MDFYLNSNNVKDRLVKEYKQYGKLIIAVDFDDTLYDYHNEGRTYRNVINLLRRWRDYSHIIIFSASKEDRYLDMIKYLNDNNIPFDKINENINDSVPQGGKLYYNILLDDRAGLKEAYKTLREIIDLIERGLI